MSRKKFRKVELSEEKDKSNQSYKMIKKKKLSEQEKSIKTGSDAENYRIKESFCKLVK